MEKIYALINLLGAVPAFLLALVIWYRGKQYLPNRTLVFGLIVYCALLLSYFLSRWGILPNTSHETVLNNALVIIAWPAFYLYLRAVTYSRRRLGWQRLLHCMPPFFYIGFFGAPTVLNVVPYKPVYIAAMAYTGSVTFFYVIAITQRFFFWRRKYENPNAETREITLTWMLRNLVIWLLLGIVQVVYTTLEASQISVPELLVSGQILILSLLSTTWVYFIAYYAIVHPDLFKLTGKRGQGPGQSVSARSGSASRSKAPRRAKKTSADEDDIEQDNTVIARLLKVMEEEKPYLDDQLTIGKVARRLDVPSYALGRTINRCLEMNFMTFVNEQRIGEIKQRLLAPDHAHETILDVAFNCGFRTKSAFNAAFKKATGMTPSKYRRTSGPETKTHDNP